MQIGVKSEHAVETKRIFVVDTDEITATALQIMLADECETHVMRDVGAAVEKAVAWAPDLVLLGADVVASEGGAAVVRLAACGRSARILIVCDSAQEPAVQLALAAGACGTLLRPLKLESVRRKVDAQLGRRLPLSIPVVRS